MGCSLTSAAVRKDVLPTIDEATVDEFITASGKVSVLFFRGDAARFPESADIAVILPELIAAFRGRLAGAVIASEAERALMRRFGVAVCPSLVLTNAERVLGVIAKIQDWSSYTAQIAGMLAAVEQAGEPELQR